MKCLSHKKSTVANYYQQKPAAIIFTLKICARDFILDNKAYNLSRILAGEGGIIIPTLMGSDDFAAVKSASFAF